VRALTIRSLALNKYMCGPFR